MRRIPDSATAQRDAARRHTERAYTERNELLGLLAAMWPAHVMPIAGKLGTLDNRRALCIHPPKGPKLAWIIDAEEIADFPGIDVFKDSHWDEATKAQRSERIAALGVHYRQKRK